MDKKDPKKKQRGKKKKKKSLNQLISENRNRFEKIQDTKQKREKIVQILADKSERLQTRRQELQERTTRLELLVQRVEQTDEELKAESSMQKNVGALNIINEARHELGIGPSEMQIEEQADHGRIALRLTILLLRLRNELRERSQAVAEESQAAVEESEEVRSKFSTAQQKLERNEKEVERLGRKGQFLDKKREELLAKRPRKKKPLILTCAICKRNIERPNDATRCPCGRVFHTGCVIQWLEQGTCPGCGKTREYYRQLEESLIKEDSNLTPIPTPDPTPRQPRPVIQIPNRQPQQPVVFLAPSPVREEQDLDYLAFVIGQQGNRI